MAGSKLAGVSARNVIVESIERATGPQVFFCDFGNPSGTPVLDVKADERLTRGFISMTAIRPVFGSVYQIVRLNTGLPRQSHATPMTRYAWFWYSLSVKVRAGATVMSRLYAHPWGQSFQSNRRWYSSFFVTDNFHPYSLSNQLSFHQSISWWVGDKSKPRSQNLRQIRHGCKRYHHPNPWR